MQNLNRDELYLFSDYDPQPYYCKLLNTDTFGKQITSQLFTALEEHNRLPSVIVIVIGNSNIDTKVMNPEHTRRVWSSLFTEIDRMIKTRKEHLPRKAQVVGEPRVLISNVFPRYKDHNDKTEKTNEPFKTKRRRLNGLLPQVAKNFGYSVINITGIVPDNSDLFTVNTGSLNGKGIKQFWTSLSSELKVDDFKQTEKKKNEIVSEYFEQQRELRRINQEQRKVAKDRFSLPRNMSFHEGGRGDNNASKRKVNHSVSVPSRVHRKRNQ